MLFFLCMLTGSHREIMSLLKGKTVKKRTIVVGLKSDNSSREMLLGLLTIVVKSGDYVIAVHVQEPNDSFDLNTFDIHEDLCMSKKVDFLVKVCAGDSYISELSREVRVNYATILVLGCRLSGPKDPVVKNCLKGLPPTCTLLVMDIAGRVIIQRQGTSQQGSAGVTLQSSQLSSSKTIGVNRPITTHQLHKPLTKPSSLASPSTRQTENSGQYRLKGTLQVPNFLGEKVFQRFSPLEVKGSSRCFTIKELDSATNNFSSEMVIGEGGHSKVYRAYLEDGQAAAVKVLKAAPFSAKELLQEVEILTCTKHENIVQIIGYCDSKDMYAVVYNLLEGSLMQHSKQLQWSERMGIAIGVAKALKYLHHCCDPPIIHRDVKSANILLSHNCKPQLSDFGAAIVLHQSQKISVTKPFNVVGTFGYLAPEYMMYGKVDEKIDVYSYGVVLLELITGKEAIQSNLSSHESLVLWARSLLRHGLCESLIDPSLNEDYKKEEMEKMVFAAGICLMHSPSKRPTMKMILSLFESSDYWLKMQREKDELLNGFGYEDETDLWRQCDLLNGC